MAQAATAPKPLQIVTLNSINYWVREIEVETVRNWGDVYAPTGGQQRATRTGGTPWNMSPHKGFGLDLLNNFADDFGYFIDSTLETRFSRFVTLSGLWVAEASWTPHHKATPASTNTDLDLKGLLNFDNEIWGFEGNNVGTTFYIYARRFDETETPAWDVTETAITQAGVGDSYTMSPLAACVVGGYMFVYAQKRNDSTATTTYAAAKRNLAGNWTTPSMTGFTNSSYVLLTSIGNRLYAATWATSGAVSLFYSDDYGDNWTAGVTTITSLYQPTGFCGAVHDDGYTVPHLCTSDALWGFSLVLAAPWKVLDFSTTVSEWNGFGMATWENGGDLYIPLGGNPLGQLVRYSHEGTTRIFSMVGFDNTSWPAARQGRIVALCSTPRWLLALVRNTGNTECGIFAADGKGWHHLYNSDTSSGGWPTTGTIKPQGFGVSNVDGTQRIHLVWDNGTTADACHMKNPLEDPTMVSGFVYESTGYLTWPWFGGDTLEDQKGFYKMWGVGDLLDATETITYAWRQDGSTGAFTDLTALTASGSTNFAAGVGVSAKTMQVRMTLARDATTTLHPLVRASVLDYETVPTTRLRFILKGIDLDASYERQDQYPLVTTIKTDRETMITNLETVRDSVTQIGLVYPYGSASRNVKYVRDTFRGVYTISKDTEDKATQQRTGFVTMAVEEK